MARAALAELKTAGQLLPDQKLLVNILPMLEAKDSSRIENIVTTSDRLFQFVDRADPATKEALRYRTAMYEGVKHLETYPLCTTTAIAVCTTLRAIDTDVRKTPGTVLRDVSAKQDWESWILFMLDAVTSTANWTSRKIAIVRELIKSTAEYVRESLPKIYSWELIQILSMQPYCRIENLVDAGLARRQTASSYLKQLVDIGVLEEMSAGREKLWLNTRLLNELNS